MPTASDKTNDTAAAEAAIAALMGGGATASDANTPAVSSVNSSTINDDFDVDAYIQSLAAKHNGGGATATPPAETTHHSATHATCGAMDDDMAAYMTQHQPEPQQQQQQPPSSAEKEFVEFSLLTNGEVVTKCPHCRAPFKDSNCEFDAGVLYPIPTKHDALLSIIGSTDVEEGATRSAEDVLGVLKSLRSLLLLALDPDMEEELELDLASPQPLSNYVEGTRALPSNPTLVISTRVDPPLLASAVKTLASVEGAVDFLVASGFQRYGTTLTFWRDEEARPCQRAVIGYELLLSEIDSIENCNGRRVKTVPCMSQIGKYLTLFDEAQKLLDTPTHFPTFDDLLKWVEIRNFFHLCVILGGVEQSDTWFEYFSTSRDTCQQVLERVESFHRSLKCDGTMSGLLRHSYLLKRAFEQAGIPMTPNGKGGAGNNNNNNSFCSMTPPEQSYSQSPQGQFNFSPGDYLTRTPPRGNPDRDYYKMAVPPMEEAWRDPDTEPAGLLNMKQCCYVNSLMQVFSRDKAFVRAIMAFPRGDILKKLLGGGGFAAEAVVTDADGKTTTTMSPSQRAVLSAGYEVPPMYKVVHRLQSLFAFMLISSASAINPIPLLDAVGQCVPQFSDEQQHDPHEFATAVLEIVNSAFEDCVAAVTNELKTFDAKHSTDEHSGSSDAKVSTPTAAEVVKCLELDEEKENSAQTAKKAVAASHPMVELAKTTLRDIEGVQKNLRGHTHYTTKSVEDLAADGIWAKEETNASPANQQHLAFVPLYVDEDAVARRSAVTDKKDQPSRAQHADPMASTMIPTEDSQALTDLHFSFDDVLTDFRENLQCESMGTIHTLQAGGQSSHAAAPALMFYLPSRCQAGSMEKAARPFTFPETLALDGYLQQSQNNDSALTIRKAMLELKRKIFLAETHVKSNADTIASLEKACASAPDDSPLKGQIMALLEAAKKESNAAQQQVCEGTVDLCEMLKKLTEKKNTPALQLELQAAVLHVGKTTVQGHYISFVKGTDGQWLQCDDTSVEPVDKEEVFGAAAQKCVYCLRYALPDGVEFNHDHTQQEEVEAAKLSSKNNDTVDVSLDDDLTQSIPRPLQTLVEKEDLRRQMRYAQRMSSTE